MREKEVLMMLLEWWENKKEVKTQVGLNVISPKIWKYYDKNLPSKIAIHIQTSASMESLIEVM